jgi:hypothetical protein
MREEDAVTKEVRGKIVRQVFSTEDYWGIQFEDGSEMTMDADMEWIYRPPVFRFVVIEGDVKKIVEIEAKTTTEAIQRMILRYKDKTWWSI